MAAYIGLSGPSKFATYGAAIGGFCAKLDRKGGKHRYARRRRMAMGRVRFAPQCGMARITEVVIT
jgi:hypothetical protein